MSEISILIAGDFYGGGRIEHLIDNEKYDAIFNDFLPEVKKADFSVLNLEAPMTELVKKLPKTGPALKSPLKTSQAIRYAGFNLVTLANNHIMDFGGQGLTDTIESLKMTNIDSVGAGMNLQQASNIFYKNVKGKTLAFVNLTENEWSTTSGMDAGSNPLNPVRNFYTIKEAKERSDFLLVLIHGGHEMHPLPSPRMKATYRFFIDAGADSVIGHHSHCLSGYEIYKGKPVFYSLGNFIFDSPLRFNSPWNFGYAVKLMILQDDIAFDILPYEQNNEIPGVHLLYERAKEEILNQVIILKNLIADDNELENQFTLYIKSVTKKYLNYLEPASNRYLNALQRRNLFPSFLTKRKRMLYLNLMRCESHRDVIINLLKTDLNL